MRILASALVIIVFVFLMPPTADVADLEPTGHVTISGGAARDEKAPAGGRGVIEFLGVLPLTRNFGLQGLGYYAGGRGSRFGLYGGPLVSWDSGKAGFFVNYQHNSFHQNNFVYLIPSLSLYSGQTNLSLWYGHHVNSPQRDREGVQYGGNKIQGTLNYFPLTDVAAFMRKDNLELTFGVQVNTFAGVGRTKQEGAGVGPVWGLAFMPAQNVVVNLFRATIDNRSRYSIFTGIQYFFDKGTPTLKELRRKYLEPNPDLPGVAGGAGGIIPPPPPTTGRDG